MNVSIKKLCSLALIFAFMVESFGFLTVFSANGGESRDGAQQLSYSPDQYWKCEQGEYFYDAQIARHRCREYLPAPALYTNYYNEGRDYNERWRSLFRDNRPKIFYVTSGGFFPWGDYDGGEIEHLGTGERFVDDTYYAAVEDWLKNYGILEESMIIRPDPNGGFYRRPNYTNQIIEWLRKKNNKEFQQFLDDWNLFTKDYKYSKITEAPNPKSPREKLIFWGRLKGRLNTMFDDFFAEVDFVSSSVLRQLSDEKIEVLYADKSRRARNVPGNASAEESAEFEKKFSFYDTLEVKEEADYLLLASADDDFLFAINNSDLLDAGAKSPGAPSGLIFQKNALYYEPGLLYPFSLPQGSHLIELQYKNSRGSIGYIASELLGPFPKGTFINADGTPKAFGEVVKYFANKDQKLESAALTRAPSFDQTKWDEKVIFTTKQFRSDSESGKSHQMIAYFDDTPGYRCLDGSLPKFRKDHRGHLVKVPYCEWQDSDAIPQPEVRISQGYYRLNKGDDASLAISGTCRSELGDVKLTIDHQSLSPLACIDNQRKIPSDFDFFTIPDGEIFLTGVQSIQLNIDGVEQTFTSMPAVSQIGISRIAIAPISDTKVRQSKNLIPISVQAHGQIVEIVVDGLPEGMSYDPISKQIIGKTTDPVGDYEIIVRAKGITGVEVQRKFILTVMRRQTNSEELVVKELPPSSEEGKKQEKPELERPIYPLENEENPGDGLVKFSDEEIFNPTIENGKCYTRREYLGIKDSTLLSMSEEFKRALSFFRSYDMTMFDSVDDFAPYRKLTREEAARFFSNFAINVLCRKPDLNLKTNYTDIENANPILKPYIELAYQLGVMKGSGQGDGEFRPKDFISKAEVNATLIRMILKSYLDESKTEGKKRYSEYNKVANELSIIEKEAGREMISRNDASLMLFRAYKNQVFDWRELDYFSYVLDARDQFVK